MIKKNWLISLIIICVLATLVQGVMILTAPEDLPIHLLILGTTWLYVGLTYYYGYKKEGTKVLIIATLINFSGMAQGIGKIFQAKSEGHLIFSELELTTLIFPVLFFLLKFYHLICSFMLHEENKKKLKAQAS